MKKISLPQIQWADFHQLPEVKLSNPKLHSVDLQEPHQMRPLQLRWNRIFPNLVWNVYIFHDFFFFKFWFRFVLYIFFKFFWLKWECFGLNTFFQSDFSIIWWPHTSWRDATLGSWYHLDYRQKELIRRSNTGRCARWRQWALIALCHFAQKKIETTRLFF